MLMVDEARAKIFEAITRASVTEDVTIAQAVGRTLAEDLNATCDNPAFDNSAMDGYTLCFADAEKAGFKLPLEGESAAGSVPGRLAPGTTMRIFTGAPMPAGADTVVMQENVTVEKGVAQLPDNMKFGQNVRRQGEDFAKGQTLYRAGGRIRAVDVALLSAAGIATMPVYRQPRAFVFATGDELISPGEPLGPGQIYESNRVATIKMLEALGAEVTDGGTIADEVEAVRKTLAEAGDYDFVVSSGGVSVGDYDLVKKVFAEIGQIDFWRVRIKPGKPVAFGRLGNQANFFGLPGNPVSSLVTFMVFVAPALDVWHHRSPREDEFLATAGAAYSRRPGRTEFLRAHLHIDAGELVATPLTGQGSHMIGALCQSTGFIRIEHDQAGFEAGDRVRVKPLGLGLFGAG